MGRMMIESLANGRDGCMHGCFGFTRIKEEQHAARIFGDPYGNIAMIGDSYQDDIGTSGGIRMATSPCLEYSHRDESPGRTVRI